MMLDRDVANSSDSMVAYWAAIKNPKLSGSYANYLQLDDSADDADWVPVNYSGAAGVYPVNAVQCKENKIVAGVECERISH